MIRKYINIGIFILIASLTLGTYIMYNNNQRLRQELSNSVANEKAFALENSGLKNENRAFKFTIEQLEYFNDSLTNKMNEVRKELKIKNGNNAEIFPAVNDTAV